MTKRNRPLSETHPQLAIEAYGWSPSEITYGSGELKTWRCPNGHIYESRVHVRARKNSKGCPVCSNRTVLFGYNDLATLFPDIASEADGWDPTQVLGTATSMASWKCSLGHKYSNTIDHRTQRKDGCPFCSGRRCLKGFNDFATTHPQWTSLIVSGPDPSTFTHGSKVTLTLRCPENHTWQARPSNLIRTTIPHGCVECRDQSRLSSRIEKNLVQKRTSERTLENLLNSENSRSISLNKKIRLTKKVEILDLDIPDIDLGEESLYTVDPQIANQANGWNPRNVLPSSSRYLPWICPVGHEFNSQVSNRKNAKCPICSGKRVLVGFNDLESKFPDIAIEADGFDPKLVLAGSHQMQNWKCAKGHSFRQSVVNRTRHGQKCPFCVNQKVLAGFNDLATIFPKVAAEAFGWDPTKILSGSSKSMKWQCAAGHSWTTTVDARVRGSGCPGCSPTGFNPNENAWLYLMKHETWDMLQIGISNNPVKRTASHKKNGWELLDIRGPMDGLLTQQLETDILKGLRQKEVKFGVPKDRPSKNQTNKNFGIETWHTASLKVSTIKELLETLNL